MLRKYYKGNDYLMKYIYLNLNIIMNRKFFRNN